MNERTNEEKNEVSEETQTNPADPTNPKVIRKQTNTKTQKEDTP